MIYFCCDHSAATSCVGSALNGIDYLEVLDSDRADDPADRQRKLLVHFINDLAGAIARRKPTSGSRAASAFATSSSPNVTPATGS